MLCIGDFINVYKKLLSAVYWSGDVTGRHYNGAQEANTGEALDPRKEEDEVWYSSGNHSNQEYPRPQLKGKTDDWHC